jgi:hypothetical protein
VPEPTRDAWPELPPLAAWQDTLTTVHLWSQLAGKIRLGLAPWTNHSWGCALYPTTSGLTTSPIPYRGRSFAVGLDFARHALRVTTSLGEQRAFDLEPMSVATFHRRTMEALGELGIEPRVFTRPVEVEVAIPFELDEVHASYDAEAVQLFWRVLLQVARVFAEFRSRFLGKVSPVHFFWGAFDLALTRFSGRTAPRHPGGAPNCADWVMEEAYSHELSSAGFWAGPGFGEAAFYSYAWPAPGGFAQRPVEPAAASWHEGLGEFILPYGALRAAADPDAALLAFLQSTYEAAADLAGWERAALERPAGAYPPVRA